jgi:hypothetical protein
MNCLKRELLPGTVAHDCNLSYSGGIRMIMVGGQPRQKLIARAHLINKLGMVVHIYNPSHIGGLWF